MVEIATLSGLAQLLIASLSGITLSEQRHSPLPALTKALIPVAVLAGALTATFIASGATTGGYVLIGVLCLSAFGALLAGISGRGLAVVSAISSLGLALSIGALIWP